MMSSIKKSLFVLRSARLLLWLPIMLNAGLITLLLTHSVYQAFLFGFALSCIASFGFLINDVRDLPVDKRNRAGKLELATESILRLAKVVAGLFLSTGLVTSTVFGIRALASLLMVAIGLSAYTYWLREKLFWANFLAALLASTPLWLPNIIFARGPSMTQSIIVVAATAILLGREVVFDIADVPGDAAAKRRTFPIVFGNQVAARIAVVWQLSGWALLTTCAATRLLPLPIAMRFLLLFTLAMFTLLFVPINLQLISHFRNSMLLKRFTLRTRLSMLLLPVIIFALLNK